jgi:hypothetical protein
MEKQVKKHLKELVQIDSQRKKLLLIGIFVVAMILTIITKWNDVDQYRVLWLIISFVLIVGVVWWYWTMSVIKQLIGHKLTESSILRELIVDIQIIKTEVKKVLSDIKKSK